MSESLEHLNDTTTETDDNAEIVIDVFPKKAEKTAVYTGRFGGKSTMVAIAAVEYHGLSLEMPIWMRLSVDRNNGSESITTEAGLPTGVKIGDEDFANRFKTIVRESMEVWFQYPPAYRKAQERLLNPLNLSATATRTEVVKRDKPA